MHFFGKLKKKRGTASHEVESTQSSTSSAHQDGKQSKLQSGKIVGNNGWLAVKEALKVVKDSVPGSFVPVKAALVVVLARVKGAQDDFFKLADRVNEFQDLFQIAKDIPPHLKVRLQQINA